MIQFEAWTQAPLAKPLHVESNGAASVQEENGAVEAEGRQDVRTIDLTEALEIGGASSHGRGEFDPNGNTVSIERELMFAAETRQQFDRAVAIYTSPLNPVLFMA